MYWSNGAQIIPPHDQGIADHIEVAFCFDRGAFTYCLQTSLEPWKDYASVVASLESHELFSDITDTIVDRHHYAQLILALLAFSCLAMIDVLAPR